MLTDGQSFLHNRLGGLQVLAPGSEDWQYVKVPLNTSFHFRILTSIPLADAKPRDLQRWRRPLNLQRRYLAFEYAPRPVRVGFNSQTKKRPSSYLITYSPPPGAQSAYERWSIVFFTRPGNSKVLRALVEHSPTIAAAVAATPEKSFETGVTAKEWFARRIKYQRIANRTVRSRL